MRPVVPSPVIALLLRAARADRPFASAEGAERRIRQRAERPAPFDPPRRLRPDVIVEREETHSWPVFVVRPASGETTGGVVLVHGGGWVHEISSAHWHLAADIAAETHAAVTVPIYPLVPVGTAAEARDGVADLVRTSRRRFGATSLAGDSAGGQIALSTALHLRGQGIRLPMTALISPALDLTWSNPLIPTVQPRDPWLATPGARVLSDRWRGELPLTDPAVSPLHGDLSGLGPLTVLSGTRDVLNPDAHLLARKARAADVEVTFRSDEGELHVHALLPTRAGRRARRLLLHSLRR